MIIRKGIFLSLAAFSLVFASGCSEEPAAGRATTQDSNIAKAVCGVMTTKSGEDSSTHYDLNPTDIESDAQYQTYLANCDTQYNSVVALAQTQCATAENAGRVISVVKVMAVQMKDGTVETHYARDASDVPCSGR